MEESVIVGSRLWTVICCYAVFGSGLFFHNSSWALPCTTFSVSVDLHYMTTLNCLKSTHLISLTIEKFFVSVGAAMKLHQKWSEWFKSKGSILTDLSRWIAA